MPRRVKIGQRDMARVERAVLRFVEKRHLFETFAKSLVEHLTGQPELEELIHFIKWRVKSEVSLREKLLRKTIEEKVKEQKNRGEFIDTDNLFEKVVDLAGVRILHLHTEQMRNIHELIMGVIEEQKYELVGKPTAHCWDREYEKLFEGYGINTETRETMYTTVHYDIVANQRTRITCELQVRSLMDEVWSEVSHRVNYPHESSSEACRDQLKVLARLTTGGTRLVDSIFKAHNAASKVNGIG